MSHLKTLFLVALLGTTPTLAAGNQPPAPLPCLLQAGNGSAGVDTEAISPSCLLFLPPVCRLTDPTCPLFWLVPIDSGVGHPDTTA